MGNTIIENKYFKQATELTKLYDTTYKLYEKLIELEKNNKVDSEEYKTIVDLIKATNDMERRQMQKFDSLTSIEMEDLIDGISELNNITELDLIDKTDLYTTNKVKRLITRFRDYIFIRNDKIELEEVNEDDIDSDDVTAVNFIFGDKKYNVGIDTLEALGFKYFGPEKSEEEIKEEEETIRIANQAYLYKNTIEDLNFLNAIDNEIKNTKSKSIRNLLIKYKYNLIYNSVFLENALIKGKDFKKEALIKKEIIKDLYEYYEEDYSLNYSNVIEEEIRTKIKELKGKEYDEESVRDTIENKIDLLYIESLMESIVDVDTLNSVREYVNITRNDNISTQTAKSLNIIKEKAKELTLK